MIFADKLTRLRKKAGVTVHFTCHEREGTGKDGKPWDRVTES